MTSLMRDVPNDVPNDEMADSIFDNYEDDLEHAPSAIAASPPVGNDVTGGPDLFTGGTEIFLPHGDRNKIATVMLGCNKRNSDGLFIGRQHKNPMLYSRVFTVAFPDGDAFIQSSRQRRQSILTIQGNRESQEEQVCHG
jgi:hypothetical protein